MDNKKGRTIIIIFLMFSVLFLSIGFSFFQDQLTVNGTVYTASSNDTWKILFDNISAKKVNGYSTASSNISSDSKSITFKCEFISAGDSCELTGDIVNNGTISATFSNYELSIKTDGVEKNTNLNNTSFSDGTLSVNLTNPTGWTKGETILNKNDSGTFKIDASLLSISGLTDTKVYTITLTYSFDQLVK